MTTKSSPVTTARSTPSVVLMAICTLVPVPAIAVHVYIINEKGEWTTVLYDSCFCCYSVYFSPFVLFTVQ